MKDETTKEETQMKIELGSRVKDVISEFTGIVIGRTEWLHGCTRYGIEGLAKDGKKGDIEWFDEARMEKLQPASEIKTSVETAEKPGGPQYDPSPRMGG